MNINTHPAGISQKLRSDYRRIIDFVSHNSRSNMLNAFRETIHLSKQMLSSGTSKLKPEGNLMIDQANNKVYCIYRLRKSGNRPHLMWKYELGDAELNEIFKETTSEFIRRHNTQSKPDKFLKFAFAFKSLF